MTDENKVDGIILVTEEATDFLNPRQEISYRSHRRELARWMISLGKDPEKAEGYSYATAKNIYRIQNGGHEQPEKTRFFTVGKESSSITREDLFTEEELKRLFRGFSSVRDRAFTMMLYESAARPGELLSRNIGDFTSNEKGVFIYHKGSKGTPDQTNQLVRSGRTLPEWLMQHPLGGGLGSIIKALVSITDYGQRYRRV